MTEALFNGFMKLWDLGMPIIMAESSRSKANIILAVQDLTGKIIK